MAAMRKTEQHYARLLNAIKADGQLHTKEAAAILGVSESTVRRLFSDMEKEGRVLRTFGGATYIQRGSNAEYIYDHEASQQLQSKEAIGLSAAQLVQSGDIIYIDAGSTTLHFARSLAERIKKEEVTGLLAVTNSFRHASVLGPLCTVFVAGGEYQPNSGSNVGSLTEDFVSSFNYSYCFLSCDGVCKQNGFFCKDIASAQISQQAIKCSNVKCMLFASSKIGKSSFYAFSFLDKINHIYTDENASDEYLSAFAAHGIITHKVSYAGVEL